MRTGTAIFPSFSHLSPSLCSFSASFRLLTTITFSPLFNQPIHFTVFPPTPTHEMHFLTYHSFYFLQTDSCTQGTAHAETKNIRISYIPLPHCSMLHYIARLPSLLQFVSQPTSLDVALFHFLLSFFLLAAGRISLQAGSYLLLLSSPLSFGGGSIFDFNS